MRWESPDPGIGEIEIGQTAVLAVGDVQAGIPGPAQQVGVLHLHLTEHTLALAVSKAAGQLTGRLLDDAEHDRDLTRCLGVGTQGDLDVTEELSRV